MEPLKVSIYAAQRFRESIYLKKEECYRRNYHTKKELELSVFQYIEGFYNSKRPHGSLGLMSPNEKEKEYWSK